VDSCSDANHEKDAEVMLIFFWLTLLTKRAATGHSSRRDAFMLRGDLDEPEWAIADADCLSTDGFCFLRSFCLHEHKRNSSGARFPAWGEEENEKKSSESGEGGFVAFLFVPCHCNEIKTTHGDSRLKLTVGAGIRRTTHACRIHGRQRWMLNLRFGKC
jgi:hypothetical protein